MKSKLIITIDGPAGSGKSSTAKALARRLGLPYIDTGAMYRAVTLKAMREGVPFTNRKRLVEIAKGVKIQFKSAQRIFLNGKDVTTAIRDPELTKNVFYVAQEPLVRREMVKKQRELGLKGGAVMEGRDIGTMVFPDAHYKFYFEANPNIRAMRRYRELKAAGVSVSLKKVLVDLKKRDKTDYERKEGPLKRAKDAFLIDTSGLTIDETIDKMVPLIRPGSFRKGR